MTLSIISTFTTATRHRHPSPARGAGDMSIQHDSAEISADLQFEIVIFWSSFSLLEKSPGAAAARRQWPGAGAGPSRSGNLEL
jgi:hypothetical protein